MSGARGYDGLRGVYEGVLFLKEKYQKNIIDFKAIALKLKVLDISKKILRSVAIYASDRTRWGRPCETLDIPFKLGNASLKGSIGIRLCWECIRTSPVRK